jgi:hypothetical protein
VSSTVVVAAAALLYRRFTRIERASTG